MNRDVLMILDTSTINILNEDETDFKKCEVTGLWADCFNVECYDFSKSTEPIWHGAVEKHIVINLINGEPIDEYVKE